MIMEEKYSFKPKERGELQGLLSGQFRFTGSPSYKGLNDTIAGQNKNNKKIFFCKERIKSHIRWRCIVGIQMSSFGPFQ